MSTTTSQPAAPAASSELERMAARFAPTDITADLSRLSADERTILAKLVEASKIYDALFLRQVWAGNETMLLDLIKDQTPEGRARLHYFLINKGPWSRLDHNQPFVAGAPPKPEGGSFYPADASKADIERWMRTLSDAERARATGFFTTIRRGAGGGFHAGAVQRGVSERAGARRGAASRGGRAGDRADAQDVPDQAGGRVSLERLLRQRRRVDGTEGHDRADDRSLRGLRGRILQLQGGVRVVRHDSGRSRERRRSRNSAANCRTSRTTCRSTRRSAIRSSARWRRSSSSTRSSRPATAIAACRRRPSIFPTTSASPGRRAPSG